MSNWSQNKQSSTANPIYDPSKHNFHKGVIDGAANEGYPKNYFFADSLRGLVVGFGNFFNDLYVVRYDENGEPIKKIQVPVKYGPRMKSHDFRVEQESGKKYYIQLPNITYRVDSVDFASDRYAGGGENRAFYSNYFEANGIDYIMFNKFWSDVQPVPQNVTITMEAKTEHISDANQIMEQIRTRFAPDAWINLKEFWFINKRRAIKMLCEGSNIEMTQDFGEEDKREITVSFTFKLEAFFYKPIQDAHVIDQIITHCGVPDGYETYNQTIMGNYSKINPFTDRYDLSYEFGTKIGRISAIKEGYPTTIFDKDKGNVVQNWEYEEQYDITNYPAGSKQILTISSIADPNSATWNGIDDILTQNAQLANVASWYSDKTLEHKYWSVTANTGLVTDNITIDTTNLNNYDETTKTIPTSAQEIIWEFTYDKGYIVKPPVVDKNGIQIPGDENKGVYGGLIVKKYKNLFGFGNFNDDIGHTLGTKETNIGGVYNPAAPYVTSSKVTNNV